MRRFALPIAVAALTLAASAGTASSAEAACKLRGVSSLTGIPYGGKAPNVAFRISFARIQDCVGAKVTSTLWTRPCTGNAQAGQRCRARGAGMKVKTGTYTISAEDLARGRDSSGCVPADSRAEVTPGRAPQCIWSVDQCTTESRQPWHWWWGTVRVSGNRKSLTTTRYIMPAKTGNPSC
ncbi:MAG: hypothetical protein ACKOTA_03010 [Solirubrobacterales bacterium]